MSSLQQKCRFQNEGFCKFREKCRFRHVKEICHNGQCEKRTCPRRHQRKCKFFFLRDHCKFGEFCEYSHDIKNNQNEELLKLKDALEETSRESKTSKNIEKENSNLRKANESLMKDVKKQAKQLEEAQTQEIKD